MSRRLPDKAKQFPCLNCQLTFTFTSKQIRKHLRDCLDDNDLSSSSADSHSSQIPSSSSTSTTISSRTNNIINNKKRKINDKNENRKELNLRESNLDWEVNEVCDEIQGVLVVLKILLLASLNDKNYLSRIIYASLSISTISYIATNVDYGKGWDCGWRNLQMLLSSVRQMDCYSDLLDTGVEGEEGGPPNFKVLHELLTIGWEAGYDSEGAQGYPGNVQENWIGTGEVQVILTVLGVRVRAIDFPTKPDVSSAKRLFNFLCNYFSISTGSVKSTTKQPVYLQWSGHSVTIVGVQKDIKGIEKFLVLDPIIDLVPEVIAAAGGKADYQPYAAQAATFPVADVIPKKYKSLLQPFTFTMEQLEKKGELQILFVVEGTVLRIEEKRQLKVLVKETF